MSLRESSWNFATNQQEMQALPTSHGSRQQRAALRSPRSAKVSVVVEVELAPRTAVASQQQMAFHKAASTVVTDGNGEKAAVAANVWLEVLAPPVAENVLTVWRLHLHCGYLRCFHKVGTSVDLLAPEILEELAHPVATTSAQHRQTLQCFASTL